MQLEVKSISRNAMDITILYEANPEQIERTLIYPYRDIDQTWVLIHYKTQGENEMYFITPQQNWASIAYLNE